jgi:hypothetical protein
MTTDTNGSAGGSLTAAEAAYFESGGETELPNEAGADDAGSGGDVTNTGGGNPDGGTNSADPDKQPTDGKPDGKPDGKQPDKAPQHVPLAALQEERGKRKELTTKVGTLETQLAETNGKLAILLRLKGGDKVEGETDQPAGPPKSTDDVFGAVDNAQDRLAKLEKAREDDAAAVKTQTEQQAFVSNYRSDATSFEQKNPDYREAYNFLLNTRAKELIAIGYDDPQALKANGADEETINAAGLALHNALIADEMAIAQTAAGKKKSAAEIIYNLAKQRGYAKKAAAKPGEGEGKGEGDAQLETIERGQAAHKSLNGTGGSADGDEMSAERLISMSAKAFETYADKHPETVRRLMGG